MITTLAPTVIGSSAIGGAIGYGYGHIQHHGRGRSHVDIRESVGTGLAVGGAIGAMAVGVTLKTGRLTSPFSQHAVNNGGVSFTPAQTKFLKGLGVP